MNSDRGWWCGRLQKPALSLFLVVLGGVAAWFWLKAPTRSRVQPETLLFYQGVASAKGVSYYVEIYEEDDRNFGLLNRLVLLRPYGRTPGLTISGQDYDCDGRWDRIYFCNDRGTDGQTTGCNGVRAEADRSWAWEPNAEDEKRVTKPGPEEIRATEALLTLIEGEIHTPDNLAQRQHWDNDQQLYIAQLSPVAK